MSIGCNNNVSYMIVLIDGVKYVETTPEYKHKWFIDYISRDTTETIKYCNSHNNERFFIGPFIYSQFINKSDLYPSQIFSLTDSSLNVYPISKSRDLLVWLIKFIDRVDNTVKHNNSFDDLLIHNNYDSSIYFL